MACNYATLYNSPKGYVVWCKECDTYQLAFLSSLVTFKNDEFKKFRRQIAIKINKAIAVPGNSKSIFLNIFSNNSRMVLTPGELEELNQMLEEADTVHQTNALLELFAL